MSSKKDEETQWLNRQLEKVNTKLFIDQEDNEYRMRISGRGETMIFSRNELVMSFEIIAGRSIIFTKSIRKWKNRSRRLSTEEKANLIEIIVQMYEEFYDCPVVLCDD